MSGRTGELDITRDKILSSSESLSNTKTNQVGSFTARVRDSAISPRELKKNIVWAVDTVATVAQGGASDNLQEFAPSDLGYSDYPSLTKQPMVYARGYYLDASSDPDGVFEGKPFQLVRDATLSDNGGTIRRANAKWDSSDGATDAFWVLQYSGAVNVLWFGAKGDDSTNDATACQAALDAGANLVFFPAGDYVCTGGLAVSQDDQEIYGEGKGSSVIKASGSTALEVRGVDRVNVHDMAFKNSDIGVQIGNTAGGVDALYCAIENCHIRGNRVGLLAADAFLNSARFNLIEFNQCGVVLKGENYAFHLTDNVIDNNQGDEDTSTVGGCGVLVMDQGGAVIRDNTIEGNRRLQSRSPSDPDDPYGVGIYYGVIFGARQVCSGNWFERNGSTNACHILIDETASTSNTFQQEIISKCLPSEWDRGNGAGSRGAVVIRDCYFAMNTEYGVYCTSTEQGGREFFHLTIDGLGVTPSNPDSPSAGNGIQVQKPVYLRKLRGKATISGIALNSTQDPTWGDNILQGLGETPVYVESVQTPGRIIYDGSWQVERPLVDAGKGIIFEGTGGTEGYLENASITGIDLDGSALTYSWKMNPDDASAASVQYLWFKSSDTGAANPEGGYEAYLDTSGRLVINLRQNNAFTSHYAIRTVREIESGVEREYTMKADYSGSDPVITLYCDGIKLDTEVQTAKTGSFDDTTGAGVDSDFFRIGSRASGSNFLGTIRDFKIFDSALSDDTILDRHVTGRWVRDDDLDGSGSDCVCWWPMDEGCGPNIIDRSGNNNSLTAASAGGYRHLALGKGIGYLSGSGSPSGSVTPEFVGQDYLDTSGNAWYKAYGLANTNWEAM